MLKVLGRPISINVRKVRWLCDELALAYEHEPWGTDGLALDSPEYLALNPNGLVPAIRDGDYVLWESNAICRYLAAKHGRTDLLPAEPAARGLVEQWMDWQATELNDAWRYAFMALVRRHADYADPAAVARSVALWNRRMALLDARLSCTGAYVAGGTFTLADVCVGLATHRWYSTPIERPALAAVHGYYERLTQRPAFRAHGRNGLP